MKKIYCPDEGYCYTEENGKIELLTPFKSKTFFVVISVVLLGILALAFM